MVFLLLLFPCAQESVEVAQELQKITVTVQSTFPECPVTGSGVLITKKFSDKNTRTFVLTAGHVANYIVPNENVKKAKVVLYSKQNDKIVETRELNATILDVCREKDIALLMVDKTNCTTNTTYFYQGTPPQGTMVYHMGSFGGREGANSFSVGYLSKHDVQIAPSVILEQYLIPTVPGSSGGGIFMKTSKVEYVGLVSQKNSNSCLLLAVVPVTIITEYFTNNGFGWLVDNSNNVVDVKELERWTETKEKK